MNLVTIIIFSFLLLVISLVAFLLIKSFITPKKLSDIKKLLKDGKIQQSQKIAKNIITKNPRDYVAHYWLGMCYMADNKPELAFIEFKTVNANGIFNGEIPEVEFRKNMAELYMRFNQPQEALKEYILLCKMEPTNADNYFNAGKIYESMGKGAVAMGYYHKAIGVNKRHGKAHAALGYLLFRSKQNAEAKKEIDLAIKLNPDSYVNYYYLGKLLKDGQDYSSALKAFEKAERDPDYKQRCLIERGACYMAVTQIDNAIVEFEHAIQVAKDEGSQETLFARYFLAACYEKVRKIEKAIEQWEKIFAKNKSFKDVATKLSEYKELQSNDNMKEYLTSGGTRFVEICKRIAFTGFSLVCQKSEETRYGCQMLCTEENKDNWMNVKQQVLLTEFYRDTEPLEDTVIRKVADTIKSMNYSKAIIFSSSEFTISAVKFAENRPIVLVGKEQLSSLLDKAGI